MTPLTSVEMICGTSALTSEPAPSAPDLLAPTLVSQPSALSTASEECLAIGSCSAVMPEMTITTTSTASAIRLSRTSAAATPRGMCFVSLLTTGADTVATIVATTTGPPIVYVAPRNQTRPKISAKRPTSSQAARPMSSSQRGAANATLS